MDLQLELLPYHYYNTLGFDAELIDYINHVDDTIVIEKIAPLYKDGGRNGNQEEYSRSRALLPRRKTGMRARSRPRV